MRNILLIDDDPMTVEFLKLFLVSEGFSVVTAFNEEEARMKFTETKPNIILTDIELGESCGFKLANFFRSQGANHLIGITGHSTEFLQNSNATEIFDSVVLKPIDFPTLRDAINRSPNQQSPIYVEL